jgi:hypothetical protein
MLLPLTMTHYLTEKFILITEGIDLFYVSMLSELQKDDALTTVNYILMKNQIKVYDNHRRLNIVVLTYLFLASW